MSPCGQIGLFCRLLTPPSGPTIVGGRFSELSPPCSSRADSIDGSRAYLPADQGPDRGGDRRRPAADGVRPARQLAVDLGINFHTVNKGYDLLRQEGLLRIAPGPSTPPPAPGGGPAARSPAPTSGRARGPRRPPQGSPRHLSAPPRESPPTCRNARDSPPRSPRQAAPRTRPPSRPGGSVRQALA